MTLEEWKVRLEEKLLAEKVIRSVLRSQEKIDEKEALRYYEIIGPYSRLARRLGCVRSLWPMGRKRSRS